jgi:hypothetical protein
MRSIAQETAHMGDMEFGDYVGELLALAYGRGSIELSEYEDLIAETLSPNARDRLNEIAERLVSRDPSILEDPQVRLPSAEAEIVCDRSSKVIRDENLLARRLVIRLSKSSVLLDFRRLKLPAGLIELVFDAHASSCMVRLPRSARVELRVESVASSVADSGRPRPGESCPTIVRVLGRVESCSLHVKRYRGGWLRKRLSAS